MDDTRYYVRYGFRKGARQPVRLRPSPVPLPRHASGRSARRQPAWPPGLNGQAAWGRQKWRLLLCLPTPAGTETLNATSVDVTVC